MNLDAYLARIGYSGPRTPTVDVLREVHRRHREVIPFENLDILLGKVPALDLPSLEAKMVDARRGGYCFEHNTLFAAVLEALGFQVQRLVGRVVTAPMPAPRPRTHMVLLAEAGHGWWLCDVGFGAWGLMEPVPLADGTHQQGEWNVRLRWEEAKASWVASCLECPVGPDLFTFDLTPQTPVDYEMANFYTARHPNSHFPKFIIAQIGALGARLVVRNYELQTLRPDGIDKQPIGGEAELLQVLAERFGLVFPAGTRFPLPES